MFSFLLFIVLSIVTLIYWLGYGRPLHGIDDANIYFVYMENFASGHGFVWEQGGEKVEGFTSLLWTLIGSLCFLFTPAHYTLLLLLLNLLLTYATIHRLLSFVRRINRQEHKTITATDILILAMLFFPLGFIEWSILTLMETGLWIFLIVYATLALADQYLGHKRINMPVFCLMIACMLLTRPEGLLFGLLLIALLFAMTWREQDLRSALRTSALPFAAYLVTAIGIILWRLSYFGYPFPNTYYAKVSGSLTDNMLEGMQYLVKFFYQFPHLAIIVAALFVQSTLLISKMLKQKSTKSLMLPEKAQAILLSVVFIGLLVPVLTGGDHFYYSRFYQPVIPLAIAASLNFPLWKKYVGKIHLRGRWFDKVLALLLSFGLFFISQSTWIDLREFQSNGSERIFQDFKIAKEGRQIAKKLNETFVEKALVPSVGIIAAGGFGYAYEGSTIDLMGLNNTIMAHANKRKSGPRNHASFDINGFWKLRPDIVGPFYGAQVVRSPSNFILPENRRGFSGSFLYKVYKGIFNSPDFVNSYKPALIKSKADHEYLFAYYHNNFLNSLDTAEYDILVLNRKTDPDQNKERQ